MTSSGNDCMMSIKRWMTRSSQPPKYPDISPIVQPNKQPSEVEPSPTASEMRAP